MATQIDIDDEQQSWVHETDTEDAYEDAGLLEGNEPTDPDGDDGGA